MRGSGFLSALCVLVSATQVSAQPQSFVERVQEATTESLAALHREFDIPRGDIDGDGAAAFADFLVLSNNYGETRENLTYADGDINLDGAVNIGDYAIFTNVFGTTWFEPAPASRPPNANLGLSRTGEDGFLTVSSVNPANISAFEIASESASLNLPPGSAGAPSNLDSSPFTFILTDGSQQILWANLGSSVTLVNDFRTIARSSANDLEIRWIEPGSYDVYSLPFGEGDALTGTVQREFAWVANPPRERPKPEIVLLDQAEDLATLLRSHQEQNIPRGELNGSSQITESDLEVLAANWNSTETTYSKGDLNLDGETGIHDLAIFAANFGRRNWVEDSDRNVEEPADLSLAIDEFGRLSLSGDRVVELGGVELAAVEGAFLDSHRPSDPFEEFAVDDSSAHAFVSFSTPVSLDEDIFLPGARLAPGLEHEVTLRWFEEGSYSVFESGPFLLGYETDSSFGDVDGNGTVEFADFLTLSNTYGQAVEPSAGADITGDGRVNFYDFLILSYNFGLDAPRAAEPVPEPNFGFHFGLLLASLWLRRVRTCRSS